MKFLLDTNPADKLLKPGAGRQRLEAIGKDQIALCRPSVGELWFMVHRSTRIDENRRNLLALLASWTVLEFDAPSAEQFGQIMAEQARAGKAIPQIDVQFAAIARSRSLTILTADKHFDVVDGISVENWLA